MAKTTERSHSGLAQTIMFAAGLTLADSSGLTQEAVLDLSETSIELLSVYPQMARSNVCRVKCRLIVNYYSFDTISKI